MNVFSMSEMIKSGWALFKENMAVCILSALVASLLSGITCGLLCGPMLAGVFIVIKKLIKRTDPKPTVNDVFGGFTYFLQTFLFILLMGIISGIINAIFALIPVLNIIVACFSSSMLLWGVILITNHNMDCIQAIKFLFSGLFTGKFLRPLLMAIVALLIGALGSIACGIGVFFTMPLCYCIISVADNKIFEDENIETSDVEVNCEE
mgnify:FL=1